MDAEQIRSIDVLRGTINAIPDQIDPGDKALSVVFKLHSHFDDVKTREQGRPIFEMKEYIMITVPGDLTCNVFRPAFEHDHMRFPEQYMRFKVGQEQTIGTPLTEWNQITRAQCDELAFFRIQTVEQLASISDGNAQKFMGLSQLRDKAKMYLEQMKSEAPMLKVQAELSTRDEKISELQTQLTMMQEMMQKLQSKQRSEEREEADA